LSRLPQEPGQAGLLPGDRLSANGQPFDDDPMKILAPLLGKQDQVTIEVERDGKKVQFSVTPSPRG